MTLIKYSISNLRSLIDCSDGYVLKLNVGGFGGDVDETPGKSYIIIKIYIKYYKFNCLTQQYYSKQHTFISSVIVTKNCSMCFAHI